MRALTTVLPMLIAPTPLDHIDAIVEQDSRGPEKSALVWNDYYIARLHDSTVREGYYGFVE